MAGMLSSDTITVAARNTARLDRDMLPLSKTSLLHLRHPRAGIDHEHLCDGAEDESYQHCHDSAYCIACGRTGECARVQGCGRYFRVDGFRAARLCQGKWHLFQQRSRRDPQEDTAGEST